MTAANRVRFHEQRQGTVEFLPIDRDRIPFHERDRDRLARHGHVITPVRHAHDRLNDMHPLLQKLQILRFVRRPKDIRVGGVRLFRTHLIVEATLDEILRHLRASTKFIDELLIKPRLVHLQRRIREQPIAIKTLDIVALERAAITPDVHIIFTHGRHEHRTRDRAPQGRRVEVGRTRGGDVEGATLQRR